MLYSVVREAMIKAGVLSSTYKFKVLSLDSRGRQYLIMMDLARQYAGETSQLAEIQCPARQGPTRYLGDCGLLACQRTCDSGFVADQCAFTRSPHAIGSQEACCCRCSASLTTQTLV
jgi:hypothetical protein